MSLIAILIASLIGSPHCAGMCGGFAALAANDRSSLTFRHFGYNLGRLATYSILGIIAGFVGQAINSSPLMAGLQNSAALIIGVVLIVAGTISLFGVPSSLKSRFLQFTSPLYKVLLQKTLLKSERFFPAIRAFLIGSVTTFLPCGWLYTYVAIACASGDPLQGLLTMAAFWVGTLPMMISIGSVFALFNTRFRSILPRISAAFVILAGIFSLGAHEGLWSLSSGSHCKNMQTSEEEKPMEHCQHHN